MSFILLFRLISRCYILYISRYIIFVLLDRIFTLYFHICVVEMKRAIDFIVLIFYICSLRFFQGAVFFFQ